MWNNFWRTPDFRLRDVIVVLTLVSHLMITLGFPLPAPSRKSKDASQPFPCQSRPCGCLTADQCWKGDCCCFTIEEKLAWAEENGVEPPEHVRPLVESRKSRPSPPKKKSCCSEAEPTSEPSVSAPPTCCTKQKPAATCCSGKQACEAEPVAECPHCAAKAKPNCCKKKAPSRTSESGVRWVVGIFAQKCRGEGPAGLFQLDPAVVPDLTPIHFPELERGDQAAPRSDRTMSLSHSPPTPPPKQI